MFGFPLEYEIVSEGDIYYDPEVTDSIYTYQYAVVPEGVELPSNVPYEKIEDLHIDKSDPLLLAESFLLTGHGEEINEYVFHGGLSITTVSNYDDDVIAALVIPEIPDEPCPEGFKWKLIIHFDDIDPVTGRPRYEWVCVEIPPPPPSPLNACGCAIPNNPRYPAGCVRVDYDGDMRPVEIAFVRVKDSWFSADRTYTDANGCWEVNKEYGGRVWMTIKFKNENVKAKDVRYWLSLLAVKDYVGKFNAPPYNNILVEYDAHASDNTSRGRRYWAAAHSINTVNQYRNKAAAHGVPLPRSGLNWTNAPGDGGAAAPMLQGVYFSSWPSFFTAVLFPIIYSLSVPNLPDVVNQYSSGEFASIFTGTGFHELGHASHYSLVEESYWFGYRNHIINNGGYGTFGGFNGSCCPERVALGEAIGNYTGAKYGGTQAGGENFEWENDFIPRGLMWDIEDVASDNVVDPNGVSILDNISGFTPNMIFNGLTPNVFSVRNFRDRLRNLHLGDTPNNATDYDEFVDVYDVFN